MGVGVRNATGLRLLTAGAAGALVAIGLGVYATAHEPASDLAITLGFHDTIAMKVWLASGSVLLALVQLGSALWMYGRLPLRAAPHWLGSLHRVSGRTAFLLSLPVAYHCLYQQGEHQPAREGQRDPGQRGRADHDHLRRERPVERAAPGCAGCHTLQAAGSSGASGPNLDGLRPDAATVEAAVRSGRGAMPGFEGRLYDSEIEAVAQYVAESAGR